MFAIPGKVWVSDLEPGQRYYYRATDSRGDRSSGMFRTAPSLCADAGVRFGVTGDWRAELAPYPAVRNVAGRSLDYFRLGGDTIYAENYSVPGEPTAATVQEYRQKYIQTLSPASGLNTWVDVRSTTPAASSVAVSAMRRASVARRQFRGFRVTAHQQSRPRIATSSVLWSTVGEADVHLRA